jgi:glucose-specific phosphotransferase system IIA component
VSADAAQPLLDVLAPVPGRAVPMADVPDPVFAASLVGPGVAVDPARARQRALAPVGGRIAKLHPHAYVVTTPEGRGVLVHLGIDTVQLKGEGFTLLAVEGEDVEVGAPVVEWDPAAVEAGGRSPVCPVVALGASPDALETVAVLGGELAAGAGLFRWR